MKRTLASILLLCTLASADCKEQEQKLKDQEAKTKQAEEQLSDLLIKTLQRDVYIKQLEVQVKTLEQNRALSILMEEGKKKCGNAVFDPNTLTCTPEVKK